MLALALDRQGLSVAIATSASEALARLDRDVPEVLVVDLWLPDLPGDVLFQQATGRHASLRQRTLFITGDLTFDATDRIQRTGCPYLYKPFDLTTFVQAVNALAGVRSGPAHRGADVERS